jgi:hypothetical protein
MTDRPRRPRQTTPPAADTLLGSLAAETKLGSLTPGPRDSQVEIGGKPSAPPAQAQPGEQPPLRLPRGGWIAMRMSGGLRFESREIVIYRDGRVTGAGVGKLSEAEMRRLRAALASISFGRLPATTGRQAPDAYAYEIAARPTRRAYAVEVFDGSIPAVLAPLIAQLRRIMLAEDRTPPAR